MALFKAQDAILKAYNKMTGKVLSSSDVIFGTPTAISSGVPRNSRVKVYPKPHTLETTILPVTYNRLHVSELGTIKVLKGSKLTVHEVLGDIRTIYEYDIADTDVVNTVLPAADGAGYCTIVLQFEPSCLGYYSGTYISTPNKLSADTIEKVNVDKLAFISIDNSSYDAVVFDNGRECHSSKSAAVRSDFGITGGICYWEVKLVKGGAILGVCDITSSMNFTGENTIGSAANSWGLDTGTGLFKHNGISTALTRVISPGEWVGISFNKATGQLKYILSDLTYTVATTANTISEVYVVGSGNDSIRSIFEFNLGADPMILTVPAGTKHGVYTLKV